MNRTETLAWTHWLRNKYRIFAEYERPDGSTEYTITVEGHTLHTVQDVEQYIQWKDDHHEQP